MSSKSIPCLEGSLTDDTEMGHIKVDLCVSFSGLFSHKGLVAAEAEELPIMPSRYHLIHKRIQVRCEEIIRFLIQFAKLCHLANYIAANPYLFSSTCYGIEALLYFSLCLFCIKRAVKPEFLPNQVISWTKKNVLGPHELWHSE